MEGLADLQFRLATALGREAASADAETSTSTTQSVQPLRDDEILEEIKTPEEGNSQQGPVKYRPKTDVEKIEHFHRGEFELQNAYYIPIKDRGDQNVLASRIKEDPSRAGRILKSITSLPDYEKWRRCNSERINKLAAEEMDKLENKEEFIAEANAMVEKLSAEYAKCDDQFRFTLTDATGVDVLALLQAILRYDSAARSTVGAENPLARFLILDCALRGPTPIMKGCNRMLENQRLDESTKKRSLEEIEYFHHFPFKLQCGIPIVLNGMEGDLYRVREAASNPEAFSTWEEATWHKLDDLASAEMNAMDEVGMDEYTRKNDRVVKELSQAYVDAGDAQYALSAASSTLIDTWALTLAILRNDSVAKSIVGLENALGRFLVTSRILERIERCRIAQD